MGLKTRMPKKVLIITSSGGGGLLQAAKAKEQEILLAHPDAVVIVRDVMNDWIWKPMGLAFVGLWNWAQRRGDVRWQSFMASASHIIDRIFWPSVFVHSIRTLFREDIDQVIDTQIMGTVAIIKALRLFNRRRNKRVHLEKVLVDLPTKKATHFLTPIKQLTQRDRKLIQVIAVPPLLEHGETEEQFWQKHCKLSVRDLRYEGFCVRQAFRAFRNAKLPTGDFPVVVRYKTEEELALMQRAFCQGSIRFEIRAGEVAFTIGASERLFMVLLGSQPAREATVQYVQRFLELGRETQTKSHLFVFAADHTPGEFSLFRTVSDLVANFPDHPKHFSVIPMSFQKDDALAPLFFRSDATCTRCGGQTAMELMATSKGQIWIHSESKKAVLDNEALLAGIPGWESANAMYLQQKAGAKIVTPETFMRLGRELLWGLR